MTRSENVSHVICKFRTATVKVRADAVAAHFNDGYVNVFPLGMDGKPANYAEIAKWAGYSCVERYAVEHELCHHFIADNLGWNHSWALRENVNHPMDQMPSHIAWEEHMVNHFQRYAHTSAPDPHNVIHLVFRGYVLVEKKFEFLRLCKKVLDDKVNIMYNHNTGDIHEYILP